MTAVKISAECTVKNALINIEQSSELPLHPTLNMKGHLPHNSRFCRIRLLLSAGHHNHGIALSINSKVVRMHAPLLKFHFQCPYNNTDTVSGPTCLKSWHLRHLPMY